MIYTAVFILYCALAVLAWGQVKKEKLHIKQPIVLLGVLFALGLGIRLVFAMQDFYYSYDMSCFKAWAEYTHSYGMAHMYDGNFFLDYPPMYMYVLWVAGALRRVLAIRYDSVACAFIIKLGPIITDMVLGALIYKITAQRRGIEQAIVATGIWLFNPAFIYTSSVWGQVDSFYILFMVLALYFVSESKTAPAAVSYAVALLTKPQALLFGPVLLLYIIEKKSWKDFFTAAGLGLGTMWCLILPFSHSLNPLWVVGLYGNTLNGYRYFTVNGYNLYAVLGLNWRQLTSSAQLINPAVIGLLLVLLFATYLNNRSKNKNFASAFISIILIFTLCTMMHERYLLPAIPLALLAWVYDKRDNYLYLSLGATAVCFGNTVLSMLSQCADLQVTRTHLIIMGCACVVVCILSLVRYIISSLENMPVKKAGQADRPWLPVAAITIVYALVAFYRLGSFNAPQTYYQADSEGQWFTIDFDKTENIRHIYTFAGMGDEYRGSGTKIDCAFEVLYAGADSQWHSLAETEHTYVFTWLDQEVERSTHQVMVRAKKAGRILNEIIFTDENGRVIRGTLSNSSESDSPYIPWNAMDESEKLPAGFDNYYYSTYFDEIYHARSAYEIKNGYYVYESTHPPLGKEIISLGITLFGMTPFGWRCMGALAGVLMLPIIYLLAMELFKKRPVALFAMALMALDFMHFTQTRIATVDSYVVLFTLIMYLCMAKYAGADQPGTEMLWLLLGGISMGCCVATKWNGAYGAVGLAVYFFITLFIKCRTMAREGKDKKQITGRALRTVLWCCFAFVLVPLSIYIASFVPVIRYKPDGFLAAFIQYQQNMFNYHSQLEAEHFFSSMWYTWLVDYKPMWYSITRSDDMASSISAFGNPVLWLAFIPGIVACAVGAVKKENTPLVIVIGYLSCLLPWMAVTRLAFIYHYFPATIFGILSVAYMADKFTHGFTDKKRTALALAYLAVLAVCFGLFFPVISGVPASQNYLNGLELLKTWYFN